MHDDLNAEARTGVAMNGCGPCCTGVQPSRCGRLKTLASYGWEAVSFLFSALDDWSPSVPELVKQGKCDLLEEERGSWRTRTTGGSGRV